MNLAALPSVLAALAVTVGLARAAAPPLSLQYYHLGGQEYVRLTDWARAKALEIRWLKRDETLQLTGHGSRLLLNVDSRESDANGVSVWLSFPVLQRNGVVYLARLDSETALKPVFFPPKNKPGLKVSSICLDPGHGGKDPGYCVGPNKEKKFTLLLAQEVRQQLIRAGLQVSLTRSSDAFIDLDERPELAHRHRADLFVSLHFNAAESSPQTVQGAQVFCLTPPGASSTNAQGEGGGAGWFPGNRNNDYNLFLAYQVQRALLRDLAVEDRGVRRARFAVLRDATMPAVLIEAGFMSHPVEGRKIFTTDYRRKLAQAIVEALLAYKHAVEQG